MGKIYSMKIGIDCRLAGLRHAGIGRYTQHLVQELLAMESDHTWVFFFFDQEQALEVLASYASFRHVEVVISPVSHYSVAEQIQMLNYFNKQNLDILHVPHFNVPIFYKRKLIVTIHDLLWHSFKGGEATTLPSWQYTLKYQFYKLVTWVAVRQATTIIVPTQTVADSLVHFYPFAQQKIAITYEGVKPHAQISEISDHQRGKMNLLYVGSLYPHKNISILLRALTQLPKYNLTIVSARSIFTEKTMIEVEKLDLQHRVTFIGKVSDQQLYEFYLESAALIQPSFSEGFGLTGIEALAVGTPVIASDISTFKEVYADTVVFFNPQDVDALISAIKSLPNFDLQTRIAKAQQIRDSFNWQKMAQQTLQLYEKI